LLDRAEKMLAEGATFIDVGGYSTRPNAPEISEEEEKKRVLPLVKELTKKFPQAYISVDTFRANVAKAAVYEGASMVNDVSGGQLDSKMFETLAALKVPYVLMHSRGNPQTMTKLTEYQNILEEMLLYYQERIQILKNLGCNDLIVDLGFGFAKTLEQNHFLLKNLTYFKVLNYPILAGVSRKSMIFRKLNIRPDGALNGTTVLNTLAIANGASLLRVHDVKEAKEVIALLKS
jgi:dihydropteroate synthase